MLLVGPIVLATQFRMTIPMLNSDVIALPLMEFNAEGQLIYSGKGKYGDRINPLIASQKEGATI